jgi:hypothetical protein
VWLRKLLINCTGEQFCLWSLAPQQNAFKRALNERKFVMIDILRADRVLRRLHILRWVAFVDVVLLIALVSCSLSGARDLVRILGPLHGGNFLLLLTIVGTAAADGLWSWWFPAAVFFTGGPIGALAGELIIRQHIARNQGIGTLRSTRPGWSQSSDEEHQP